MIYFGKDVVINMTEEINNNNNNLCVHLQSDPVEAIEGREPPKYVKDNGSNNQERKDRGWMWPDGDEPKNKTYCCLHPRMPHYDSKNGGN